MPVLHRCEPPGAPRCKRVDGVSDQEVGIAWDLPGVATGVIGRGGTELTDFDPHCAGDTLSPWTDTIRPTSGHVTPVQSAGQGSRPLAAHSVNICYHSVLMP